MNFLSRWFTVSVCVPLFQVEATFGGSFARSAVAVQNATARRTRARHSVGHPVRRSARKASCNRSIVITSLLSPRSQRLNPNLNEPFCPDSINERRFPVTIVIVLHWTAKASIGRYRSIAGNVYFCRRATIPKIRNISPMTQIPILPSVNAGTTIIGNAANSQSAPLTLFDRITLLDLPII